MLKCKMRSFFAFVCVCYWCLFTAWSDSYMVPYLLTALLGVWARAKRDRSALPARRERIGASVCAVVLSCAVALANYSLFFGSGGSTFQKLHSIEPEFLSRSSG